MLEDHWRDVLQEYQALDPNHLMESPWKDLYNNDWSLYPLFGRGRHYKNHCVKFPKTTALLDKIDSLTNASFSVLAPQTHIKPHEGYTDTVLRCHLGLIVPEGCAISVDNKVQQWQQGKCLVFDDTVIHEAWNKSDKPRVILLLDFLKKRALKK